MSVVLVVAAAVARAFCLVVAVFVAMIIPPLIREFIDAPLLEDGEDLDEWPAAA